MVVHHSGLLVWGLTDQTVRCFFETCLSEASSADCSHLRPPTQNQHIYYTYMRGSPDVARQPGSCSQLNGQLSLNGPKHLSFIHSPFLIDLLDRMQTLLHTHTHAHTHMHIHAHVHTHTHWQCLPAGSWNPCCCWWFVLFYHSQTETNREDGLVSHTHTHTHTHTHRGRGSAIFPAPHHSVEAAGEGQQRLGAVCSRKTLLSAFIWAS